MGKCFFGLSINGPLLGAFYYYFTNVLDISKNSFTLRSFFILEIKRRV
jgi:hypothetical protein